MNSKLYVDQPAESDWTLLERERVCHPGWDLNQYVPFCFKFLPNSWYNKVNLQRSGPPNSKAGCANTSCSVFYYLSCFTTKQMLLYQWSIQWSTAGSGRAHLLTCLVTKKYWHLCGLLRQSFHNAFPVLLIGPDHPLPSTPIELVHLGRSRIPAVWKLDCIGCNRILLNPIMGILLFRSA